MHRLLPIIVAVLACLPLCAQPVPSIQVDNPIVGFSITIPEDWFMATSNAGNIEIAIDAVTGATLAAQPALWFANTAKAPQQEALAIARDLTLLGNGARAEARPTGRPDEWEVRMQSNGTRGPLIERWVCRRERNRNYLIAAFARPDIYAQFQADIDLALQSCHLIPTISQTFFREPTENAYRLSIPSNWQWEGVIWRDSANPGYFVWKAQDPTGSAGAFSSPPGAFNISVPYTPAPQSAEAFVLPFLRTELPDARLVDVHPLQRVGATGVMLIRAAGLGANPRLDVCHADYVGTYRGHQVRMRATIWTWMLDQSVVMGGRGNWLMNCSGAWGPVNDFDRNYAIGSAVLSSMRVDRRWRVNQANTVNDVLNNRNAAMDRWFTDWDTFIRDHEPTTDPKTGERKEVPIGDGDVWIDPLTGKAHRVSPNDEQGARDKNWDRVPK